MPNDFGSRGDLQRLPLLNHDDDRPTKVEDRTLADVIVESFDSLTTTFDEFTRHLETLNKRDVYEAAKQAIIDTKANGGGRGGTPTNVTINDTLTKNFEEVKRYWLAKAQREEALAKQQQKTLEEQERKRLETMQKASIDGFLKWTNQALGSNPIAFLQDFMWKKAVEPLIMKLGGSEQQKKEEELNLKQEREKEKKEEEEKEQTRIENLELLLDNTSDKIVSGFDESLHRNLQEFSDDLVQFSSMLFSSLMNTTAQNGGVGINPIGMAIGGLKALGTNIDAQDDVEDVQKAQDNISALIETPNDTELGKELIDALDKDSVEQEKEEEEKQKSIFSNIFSNPALMGGLKLFGIISGVTFIVNAVTEMLGLFKDWKDKLPTWMGGKGKLASLPVNVIDSKDAEIKNLDKIIASNKINEKMMDKIGKEVEASIGSDLYTQYAFSVDKGMGTRKLSNRDFVDLLNKSSIITDRDMLDKKVFRDTTNISNNKNKQKMISDYLKKYEAKRLVSEKLGRNLSADEIKNIENNIDLSGTIDPSFSQIPLSASELTSISERMDLIGNSVQDSFTWSGYGGNMVSSNGRDFTILDTEITDEHTKVLSNKQLQAVTANSYLSFQDKKVADYREQLDAIENDKKMSERDKQLKKDMLFSEVSPTIMSSGTMANTNSIIYATRHTEDCDVGGGK